MFSPDSQRILTSGSDHTARVWSVAKGQLIVTVQSHSGSVERAAFSPDGARILTASDDKTARLFRLVTFLEIVDLLENDAE
jgi:WD40 repeat protein